MSKSSLTLTAAALVLAACSPSSPPPSADVSFPCVWPSSPGFAPMADIDQKKIVEPSGVCYHPLRGTIFVVGDQGEVDELRTDGTPVSAVPVSGDLEEITVDPSTGLLYILVEAADIILEFDPVQGEVRRRFPVERSFGGDPSFLRVTQPFDNGLESMAFIPSATHPEGGTFIVGNQEDPPCLVEVEVPLRSSGPAGGPAKIIRVLTTEIQDPAAMYFDAQTGLLNVVCDAPNVLLEMTLQGKVVKSYAFPGNDQEGVCRDPDGYIYIAQDSGGILKLRDLRKR
ncbi:MAG: hypothetical protein FJY80_07605 [Candidatus Aminicenantes bacterium]|nr:hypothetical protein [Candidatus Aminicenantes bacterium]